jgi:hypothetical protein
VTCDLGPGVRRTSPGLRRDVSRGKVIEALAFGGRARDARAEGPRLQGVCRLRHALRSAHSTTLDAPTPDPYAHRSGATHLDSKHRIETVFETRHRRYRPRPHGAPLPRST